MANLILPNVDLVAQLTTLLSGHWTGASIRLFTNSYTVIKTTIASDLTEATYSGYSPQAVSFSSPVLDTGNNWAVSTSSVAVFISTDPATITVYGAFILDPYTGNLLAAYNFTSPQTVDPSNPAVVAQVQVTHESKY